MNTLKKLVHTASDNLSLVLGNGINRFESLESNNSWEKMLADIAGRYFPSYSRKHSEGISLLELYDLIELKYQHKTNTTHLVDEVCKILNTWKPFAQHHRITTWAKHTNTPILTSNFDTLLADSCAATLRNTSSNRPSFYYPWSSYYSTQQVQDIRSEFAIWHMHGMLKYRRSLRLGLSDYMGSVHRLRSWLYRGRKDRLFASMHMLERWKGKSTWLQAFFGNDLIFVGISLDQIEIFLRWSLIERKKLYQKFPQLQRRAWYVFSGDLEKSGKDLFLQEIGVTAVKVNSYKEIYGSDAWAIR